MQREKGAFKNYVISMLGPVNILCNQGRGYGGEVTLDMISDYLGMGSRRPQLVSHITITSSDSVNMNDN